MSTTIICPNCTTQFEPTEALAQTIREEMRKEFNQKWEEQIKEKENNFKAREQQLKSQQELLATQKEAQEQELDRKLAASKKTMENELSKQLTQKIQGDFENKITMLQDAESSNKAKLAEWREKELEFLKERQNLQTRERELELETERKLAEQRSKLLEAIKKEEADKNKIREAEYAAQLDEKNRQIEAQQKWAAELKEKENSFLLREQQLQQQQAQQEQELNKKLDTYKITAEKEIALQLTSQLQSEFEHKLKHLEETNKTNEGKLTEARQKELEFLKEMQQLKTREQELELEVQRKLMDERQKLSEQIKKEEEERSRQRDAEFNMKLMEKDKQIEDQRRLVEEMRRKAEQGSMQLQGEVMELALEALLKNSFPFDIVSEVGKGVRGADCILTVRNSYGQECGKIIFESKRTKDFSEDWIEKLKADSRTLNADVAVIVTQAMPKGMENFGEKNGIWICNFEDVKPLVYVLRDLVMKVYTAGKSQENKGDKMTLLYNYLVSSEFSEQWNAIREGFMTMKISIQKERDQMEKLWKAREKSLEKVLLNAAHIRGSIEGIAGMEVDLNLLQEGNSYASLNEGQ